METKQWILLIAINLLVGLLVLSPFLPGPSFMSGPTNSLFVVAQLGNMIGIILIPIGLYSTIRNITSRSKHKILHILLWTVPANVFILSIWGAEMARDLSRNIAINNADNLIKAVEKYKIVRNQYPNEVSDLTPTFIERIPSPWIMGIQGYHYEKKNQGYDITFTQNVIMGFNFEVVVYNPENKHTAQGELSTMHKTGKEGWSYYIYD
jgi:hypothetical protein